MKHTDVFLIGICGGSGSGKTSFVRALKNSFSDESICFISQDEYYLPREEQVSDEQGVKNFDLPTAVDSKTLVQDIHRLLEGEQVQRSRYNFNNPEAAPAIVTYKPAKLILVEGLFILHEKALRELFDLKIFINTTDPLKIIRRIKRDLTERNYPLEDVLYRYENHVVPAYRLYLKPYKSICDLVINNDHSFGQALNVLKAFLNTKLK